MTNIHKVGIIGCGMVGSSTAFALMYSGMFTDIVLIDANRDRAIGEAMDLNHCCPFITPVELRAGDYADLADCGIIIITAGVGQKPGESRLDCLKKNTEIFKSIVPQIVKHNANAFILVVSNPVDVLTYVALKLSGLSQSKVFGSGTVLDTARLKYIIGKRLGVDPRSVHAFVIGEHGDSELPVWSSANISGIDLKNYCEIKNISIKSEDKHNVEFDVVNSAYAIIERKGATYYGIAAAVRRICESIIRDEHSVLPVSTLACGHYGLNDMCISVPSLVGGKGVEDILDIRLDSHEASALARSAQTLKDAIKDIGF